MIRFAIAAALVGLVSVALSPSAKAGEWDKLTVFSVNQPIQVTNTVLPAGKYVMKLLDSQSDRHIVQIFNRNQNHLYTTVLAIPAYRLEPTGRTVLTFWETPPGQPKALRDWYYPGDNFGQEFPQPKYEHIAAVTPAPAPPVAAAQAPQPAPAPAPQPPQEVAQNTPPPQPAPQAAPAPQPAPQPAPKELPKTASPYPWFGLGGIASLALFGLVRRYRLS
ncbi:MAG TPA: LPXTG cell wall anchor domain-containing protein [Bryobacteraceae bacterium]|nr:LPXTG cell wall anchor domain-containing protein [Bryobacteraceae bacterium]